VGRSVLIVDDSEVLRQILRHFLETQTDWQIAGEASDGAEAIKKAVELKPDLVILDFSMPTMNGIEVASVIKKLVPGACVVMFTMFADSLGATVSVAAGVDLIASKIDGLGNLVQGVQRVLEAAAKSNVKSVQDSDAQN
jgi:DNA-binding NarL/FixJ family response regulator